MLYLLRHGETVWNTEGRYQGQKDSPLTARGISQANLLGQIIARVKSRSAAPLLAYVSPLVRARQTADIIARHIEIDPIDEPRLAEVSAGSWDGMSQYEILVEYPNSLTGADMFDWYFRRCGRIDSLLTMLA
jgi:probable phosphoglycerate mutase